LTNTLSQCGSTVVSGDIEINSFIVPRARTCSLAAGVHVERRELFYREEAVEDMRGSSSALSSSSMATDMTRTWREEVVPKQIEVSTHITLIKSIIRFAPRIVPSSTINHDYVLDSDCSWSNNIYDSKLKIKLSY